MGVVFRSDEAFDEYHGPIIAHYKALIDSDID